MLRRARQQREERPTGGVGPPGAAVEPSGHPCAPERVLEEAEIAVWRADKDRDLVEPDARSRSPKNATRDLHAFTAFPRRGKELDRAVERALGRLRVGGEQELPQASQVVRWGHTPLTRRLTGRRRQFPSHRHEPPNRVAIAMRDGRRHARGSRDHGCYEVAFGRVFDPDIEQDDHVFQRRGATDRRVTRGLTNQPGGRGEQIRPVDGGRAVEGGLEVLEEAGEVGTGERERRQIAAADPGQAQFLERPGQRAREPGCRGDRIEVAEGPRARGLEYGARRHRLCAKPRARRQSVGGQRDDRRPRGQLRQAQTPDAERGGHQQGHVARQIVCRTARGADDQHPRPWRHTRERPRARRPGALGLTEETKRGKGSITVPAISPGLRYGSTTLPSTTGRYHSNDGAKARGRVLGREAFADPGAVRLPAVLQTVVQPVFASLPELEFLRNDAIAAPPVGPRHLTVGIGPPRRLETRVERRAAVEHLASGEPRRR